MDDLPSRIFVWGLGRENTAFLRFLGRIGWQGTCLLYDDAQAPVDPALKELGFDLEDVATHDLRRGLASVGLVIRSPGLSAYREELQEAISAGGTVSTSTGLAMTRLDPARCIGITGTKGKSTTSTMLHHVLQSAGRKAALVGNIGKPLIDVVPETDAETLYVIELSSYQVTDLMAHPHHAILLNLFSDHLDWHHGIENYHRDKLRLVTNDEVEWCAVHGDLRARLEDQLDAEADWFCAPGGVHLDGAQIIHGSERFDASELFARFGPHMMQNACAVLTAARHLGLSWDEATAGLSTCEPLEHRQQVLELPGPVRFVNDSISTTPETALAAIDRFAGARLHLIIGGSDRGVDYSALTARLSDEGIKAVYLVGEVGARLNETLGAAAHVHHVQTLDRAMAVLEAGPGDVVLLSPAAASHDQFKNFEARGKRFAELAQALVEQQGNG